MDNKAMKCVVNKEPYKHGYILWVAGVGEIGLYEKEKDANKYCEEINELIAQILSSLPKPSTDREAWHDTIYMEVDAAFMSLLGNPMNMPKIRDITVESILGAIDSLLEPKVLSSREEREQTARESFGNH